MVFCAYAEKLFWEGDSKHPHPQSTVSCEHTLSELCEHQPHSQATPRFYLAALIKILEWPGNEATHHTASSVVCHKSVMRFYTRLSICEYATNISDTYTCTLEVAYHVKMSTFYVKLNVDLFYFKIIISYHTVKNAMCTQLILSVYCHVLFL